jgi:hypothetical protein
MRTDEQLKLMSSIPRIALQLERTPDGPERTTSMKPWKVLLPVLAVVLAAPAVASARDDDPAGGLQTTVATTMTCLDPLIEHPFAAFGDGLDYVLAPNGSFESTNGWELTGGAAATPGNDPFQLQGGEDGNVLSMPAGSTATSPLMCVDPSYPTFRFAERQLGRKGALRIEVSYPFADNDSFRKADSVRQAGTNGWTITDPLDLRPARGGDGPGWRPMAIRFIARDGGSSGGFELDDVFVDPRLKG